MSDSPMSKKQLIVEVSSLENSLAKFKDAWERAEKGKRVRTQHKMTELIEETIIKIPRGKIFLAETIYEKFPVKTVQRVLSKLSKKNEIGSLCRGMYFRAIKSSNLPGYALPPRTEEIVKAISKKTGEIISIHSCSALNWVGLSTQIPVRSVYYTTGRSRIIKINGKRSIRLEHISSKKIVMPETVVCIVITALWYVGKDRVDTLTIKKIHDRIGDEDFNEVLKQGDKMPAWMRKILLCYQNMEPNDRELEMENLDSWYQG
jgi:hypothetical protein